MALKLLLTRATSAGRQAAQKTLDGWKQEG